MTNKQKEIFENIKILFYEASNNKELNKGLIFNMSQLEELVLLIRQIAECEESNSIKLDKDGNIYW